MERPTSQSYLRHPVPRVTIRIMPSTFTSLHYHVIYSTKNREGLIHNSWREQLHGYLAGTVRGLGGVPEGVGGVGGVADHVHLLFALKASHCLADFMRQLKKASSAWVRNETSESGFNWQGGVCRVFCERLRPWRGPGIHCATRGASSRQNNPRGTCGISHLVWNFI